MSADYERNFREELEAGQCKPNHGCNVASACMCGLAEEAIDENDRLRGRITELEKALKPFAALADRAEEMEYDAALLPCPFCGGEVVWVGPHQHVIICREPCGALFHFPICSVRSHAKRLFNRRETRQGLREDHPGVINAAERSQKPEPDRQD